MWMVDWMEWSIDTVNKCLRRWLYRDDLVTCTEELVYCHRGSEALM